jgi:septin family protein
LTITYHPLTSYSVLVVGAKNSGKTSFLNFLKASLALPPKKRAARGPEDVFDSPPTTARANRNFIHHYLETEIDGERVGLTIWDSQGLEKNVVDLQLREISAFIELKFDETFNEEMKVVRAPGVQDTHIHLVFLIIDPSRLDTNIQASQQSMTNGSSTGKHSRTSRFVGGLEEDFDLQVLRTLQGKTTVVPVISKADTITTAHMAFLKKTVSESLKMAGLDPLEALHLDADDEDDTSEDFDRLDEREEDQEAVRYSEEVNSSNDPGTPRTEDSDTVPNEQPKPAVKRRLSQQRKSSSSFGQAAMIESSYLPLSILSPDQYSLPPNEGPVGRKFPWGFADPYNPEHCDFVKLKETCFGEWRAELREASREVFYERWRTSRLNRHGASANGGGAARGVRAPSGGIPAGILKNTRR